MTRESCYLEVDQGVMAHATVPDAPVPGRASVLLVPPFGWEDVASYRARRRWADALAARGHHVLRLDLPSTGDSAGGPGDPDRLAAWTDAIDAGAAWLKARAGGGRVAAVGLGLGGYATWTAAARGGAVDDVALWGVAGKGRAAVRALRAFAALKAGEWGDEQPEDSGLPEGWLEAAGYLLSAQTQEALSAVDLTATPLPEVGRRRVLLLAEPENARDAKLADALRAGGAEVTVGDGAGWSGFTHDPQVPELPEGAVAALAGWLDGAPAEPVGAAPAPPATSEALTLGPVRERPVVWPRDHGSQAGVAAEPADAAHSGLGILFVNGGAVRRTGPNRMWVEAARRWAARGVASVRMDVEGLGDSDGEPDYTDTGALYTPSINAQIRRTVDDMVREGLAERVVVVGLCAGAAWAFHAALDGDDRIAAAVLVNLFAFWWDEELLVERDVSASRTLLTAEGWKRIARGNLNWDRARALAVRAARTPFERGERRSRKAQRGGQLDAAFDRIRDSGKRLTLVIGVDEGVRHRFEEEGRMARLAEWPNLVWRDIPARDHTFRAVWLQRHVHAQLDEAIAAELPAEVAGP